MAWRNSDPLNEGTGKSPSLNRQNERCKCRRSFQWKWTQMSMNTKTFALTLYRVLGTLSPQLRRARFWTAGRVYAGFSASSCKMTLARAIGTPLAQPRPSLSPPEPALKGSEKLGVFRHSRNVTRRNRLVRASPASSSFKKLLEQDTDKYGQKNELSVFVSDWERNGDECFQLEMVYAKTYEILNCVYDCRMRKCSVLCSVWDEVFMQVIITMIN